MVWAGKFLENYKASDDEYPVHYVLQKIFCKAGSHSSNNRIFKDKAGGELKRYH